MRVLDKGEVALIDFMPHPTTGVSGDLAIVNAARVSFLGESKGDESDKKLLRYLLKNQHTSPFEQVQFKFRITAPLICWWQIVRHRTASINLQSARYTPFEENCFYFPSNWRYQSESNKQGSSNDVMSRDEEVSFISAMYDDKGDQYPYDYLSDESMGVNDLLKWYYDTGFDIYKKLLDHGIAKEQARLFLPGFSVYYTGVWLMDAHNLMHFLKLRMDDHAQYEIREYANAIYAIFKDRLPWTAEAFEEFILNV